jgi:uncharacterized membrane protein
VHAFNARHAARSILHTGLTANRWLVGGVALSTALLLLGIYHPVLNVVFGQEVLSTANWLKVAGGLVVFMVLAEGFKLVRRHTVSRSDRMSRSQ